MIKGQPEPGGEVFLHHVHFGAVILDRFPSLGGGQFGGGAMFVGGAADPSLEPPNVRHVYDQLDGYLPGLRKKVLLPGVGHGAAEESADQVNALLLEFLGQLPSR